MVSAVIPSSAAAETMVEATATIVAIVAMVMVVGRRTVLTMSLTAQWWNFGMCVCLER